MTWEDLLNEGKVETHQTSRQELDELRSVVARDLTDAEIAHLSDDRKFATAYNAALQSAKMVIACCGYRVKGFGAHHITFECLKLAIGRPIYKIANFLDQCRRKRNIADYDAAGRIAETEANEAIKVAKFFAKEVEKWISDNYPDFR